VAGTTALAVDPIHHLGLKVLVVVPVRPPAFGMKALVVIPVNPLLAGMKSFVLMNQLVVGMKALEVTNHLRMPGMKVFALVKHLAIYSVG
jgi:hypothetical protein